MADEIKGETDLSRAKLVRLSSMGLHPDALNSELRARLSLLDEDELAVLQSIKAKLNSGLTDKLKQAADTVGGFVW